jgi:hypothetical protein
VHRRLFGSGIHSLPLLLWFPAGRKSLSPSELPRLDAPCTIRSRPTDDLEIRIIESFRQSWRRPSRFRKGHGNRARPWPRGNAGEVDPSRRRPSERRPAKAKGLAASRHRSLGRNSVRRRTSRHRAQRPPAQGHVAFDGNPSGARAIKKSAVKLIKGAFQEGQTRQARRSLLAEIGSSSDRGHCSRRCNGISCGPRIRLALRLSAKVDLSTLPESSPSHACRSGGGSSTRHASSPWSNNTKGQVAATRASSTPPR